MHTHFSSRPRLIFASLSLRMWSFPSLIKERAIHNCVGVVLAQGNVATSQSCGKQTKDRYRRENLILIRLLHLNISKMIPCLPNKAIRLKVCFLETNSVFDISKQHFLLPGHYSVTTKNVLHLFTWATMLITFQFS